MSTKPASMLWELIGRLAGTNLTIRISGETGVGKEAIARLLHNHYPRKDGKFNKFNCLELSIAPNHSGVRCKCAEVRHKLEKILASPENRVLYFENIESLPMDFQFKLHDVIHLNCPDAPLWVFASSIEPLERHRQKEKIIAKLFDDLNSIHIAVPPMRSRSDRIPQILTWILSQADPDKDASHKNMPDLQSMQRLINYHWPGNWRQLQKVAIESLFEKGWDGALEGMEDLSAGHDTEINELAAINILAAANLDINKERVMDALMTASSLEDVGLLDFAIFNEAVAQIAGQLSPTDIQSEKKPTSDS